MVQSIPGVVRQQLRIKDTSLHPSPAEAREYAKEVASFIVTHFKRFEKISDARQPAHLGVNEPLPGSDSESEGDEYDWDALLANPRRAEAIRNRGLQSIVLAMVELMSVLNGCWWHEEMCHYCSGAQCCPLLRGEDRRKKIVARIAAALHKTVFRAVPAPPAVNKWTKLAPVCDLLVLGLLTHNIFRNAFKL